MATDPHAQGFEPLGLYDRLRYTMLEDHGPADRGDVTSRALVPDGRTARGRILAKAEGVLCGVNLLTLIFQMAEELVFDRAADRVQALQEAGDEAVAGKGTMDAVSELAQEVQREAFQVKVLLKDGTRVKPGDTVAELTGPAQALLFGERTALNLMCHLSGVATQTARYVQEVQGTKAQVCDTRKTTPLWRDLEKYAVKCGGGTNHRIGLYDMVLIKDNHLALWGAHHPGDAVNAAQQRYPGVPVMIEVPDLTVLAKVCRKSQPTYMLLDNFSVEKVREAVGWCDKFYETREGRPQLEASGGITLKTLRGYAEAGIDRVSVGALTHSVTALDLSLDIILS